MLLIPFVENAFMHGVSLKSTSYISVQLSTTSNGIIFEVTNSLPSEKVGGKGSGLGLKNTKKRLDLSYPDSYLLEIEQGQKDYKVTLTLNE